MKFSVNGRVNFLLIASYIMLTGFFWDNAEDEASKFVRELKANTKPSSNLDFGDLPELGVYRPFLYTKNAEDPFKLKGFVVQQNDVDDFDFVCEGDDCGDPPPKVHEPYFLEQYDLKALRMRGTIERHNEKVALIDTPDFGLQEVRVGEYMGTNYGEVMEIYDDGVLIKEKYRQSRGWRDSEITLWLELNN